MFPIDVKVSKKKTVTFDADEGIMPTTAEGLAGLRPVLPDGVHTRISASCTDQSHRMIEHPLQGLA